VVQPKAWLLQVKQIMLAAFLRILGERGGERWKTIVNVFSNCPLEDRSSLLQVDMGTQESSLNPNTDGQTSWFLLCICDPGFEATLSRHGQTALWK
jgi:hypothetical protein